MGKYTTSVFRQAGQSGTAKTRERLDVRQLQRLFAYTKPYRKLLIFGIASAAISAALGLVFPQFVGQFFDAFISGSSTAGLDRVVFLLILLFAIQALFNFFRTYLLNITGEAVVADLRSNLYDHLIYLPIAFFENRKTGEITSRLTSDISTVQGVVSTSLAQLINQLVLLLGSIVLIVVTNFRLTSLMLLSVPIVVLAAIFFGRRIRKLSTQFQDLLADANASAEEAISGIRVVKSFTAEALESQRYHEKVRASYQLARKRAIARGFFVAGIFFAMFSAVSLVLWYGGRLVFLGDISAGDLSKFLLYTLFVAGAVGSLTGLYSQFQEALGASKRIFELLDSPSELLEQTEQSLAQTQGKLSFENVSFRYGDRGETPILKHISLEAKPGEVLAIVGPSGSGKSTLLTLIPRFYDPSEGRILLDGTDIRHLKLPDLRKHIGLVPQETQLFSGSIAENIRYGRPDASGEDLIEAAKAANAHDFILSFPQGYETIVGERGIKLSGGQRQRIAIARALLKNPRILILDEATSSLDSESEALVQEALDYLMKGRTTFVIAHRLSTIHHAHKILVLDNGEFIEQGSHSELIAQAGLYKSLYEQQFRPTKVQSDLS